jgi:hypothetical protein
VRTTSTAQKRGGRKKCAACASPDQVDIDHALVAGASIRKLSRRYDISRTALTAHKRNHVSPALVAVREERGRAFAVNTVERLETLFETGSAILSAARESHNAALALAALREIRATVELIARVTGELDERPQVTVNLQQTAEWIQVQAVVVKFVDEKLGPKEAAELSRRLRVLDGART